MKPLLPWATQRCLELPHFAFLDAAIALRLITTVAIQFADVWAFRCHLDMSRLSKHEAQAAR